jgi:hypothetical protein
MSELPRCGSFGYLRVRVDSVSSGGLCEVHPDGCVRLEMIDRKKRGVGISLFCVPLEAFVPVEVFDKAIAAGVEKKLKERQEW